MQLYYISDNVFISKEVELGPQWKVICIEMDNENTRFEKFEGPFTSLKKMRNFSKKYNQYFKEYPKRAVSLLEEKNISYAKDFVFTDAEKTFTKEFIKLMDHSIRGDVKNRKIFGINIKDVSGIHLFDPSIMILKEIINEEDKNGIWEAVILAFNEKDGKFYESKTKSFFPVQWTIQRFFEEIEFAVNNKVKSNDGRPNIYVSKTRDGIPVEMFIRDKKVVTIYPIYSKKIDDYSSESEAI